MKLTPQFIRLYHKTSGRYNKLTAKLTGDMAADSERNTFLHPLKKSLRNLRDLRIVKAEKSQHAIS